MALFNSYELGIPITVILSIFSIGRASLKWKTPRIYTYYVFQYLCIDNGGMRPDGQIEDCAHARNYFTRINTNDSAKTSISSFI